MKKILSLILALIFICCFGACQNNPPTPDDPSPDPHNTPQVQAAYRMEEAEYSLPQKQFLVIPSHNDSRLLVIESDGSGYDPAHNNAFVYQLISQQEANLSGYAFDARLVGDTVYWLGLVPDESGKRSMYLLKTDLSGSSTETVYAPPAGYQFIEAVSSDSRYVVWAEYDGENGVSDDKPLVLKSHNCATGEITTLASTNIVSGAFSDFPVNNGYITYLRRVDNGFDIIGYQLGTGTEQKLVTVSAQPKNYAFDGKRLVWADDEQLYTMAAGETEPQKVDVGTGVVDCNIYDGRYIIFCQDFVLKVYDTAAGKVVFSASDLENWTEDSLMLNFFTLDAEAGVVVAERTTRAEKSSNYSVFTLKFVPENG